MWYIYVLQSKKDGNWYTGSTNDLRRRLQEHNRGKDPATRERGPWILSYYEACRNKESTREREKYLKTAWGKRYLRKRISNGLTPVR